MTAAAAVATQMKLRRRKQPSQAAAATTNRPMRMDPTRRQLIRRNPSTFVSCQTRKHQNWAYVPFARASETHNL